jgi:6-phosphogluconolactonase
MKKEKHTRRSFLQVTGLALAGLPFALPAGASLPARKKDKTFLVYVGTYAKADADSLYGIRLNALTGALSHAFSVKGMPNASFLALDSQRRYLYAVNETGDFQGAKSGAVSAYAINQKTGNLTFLNQQQSLGGYPCYVSLDKSNKVVLVANYMGGNVATFPVQANGALGAVADMVQHIGKGVHKNQGSPHAHSILPDPDNRFCLAVDLGIDKILKYQLEADSGKLKPFEAPAFITNPGAGPRMLTFHPNNRYAYLICELDSSMYALAYQAKEGTFQELQHIATVPSGFTGKNACAHVQVSPDGRFLYGSNRGHNSIVVYAIDAGTGKLTLVQHVDTQGDTPKNFVIAPTGNILLAANQKSNNIVAFHIDKKTGKLSPTGHQIEVPLPIFLQVVPDFS